MLLLLLLLLFASFSLLCRVLSSQPVTTPCVPDNERETLHAMEIFLPLSVIVCVSLRARKEFFAIPRP